jgi:hypothetical protein
MCAFYYWYSDFVDCDVIPMHACSLLPGRPWQLDRVSVHNGKTNQYSLMHDGKKIGPKPMNLEQILKDYLARASRLEKEEKHKSENQIIAADFVPPKHTSKSVSNHAIEIHLKNPCLLASKSDIAELDVNITPCYAIICKEVMFSFEDMPPSLPPVVANLLQKFIDVFPQDVPHGLPPIHGIEHQIDFIPGAHCPTVLHTTPILKKPKRFNDKFRVHWTKVTFMSLLVHVLFLLFRYLRKMVLHARVLIVKLLIILPFNTITLYHVWMICLIS